MGDAINEEAEGGGFDSNDESGLRIDDDIYIPPPPSSCIAELDTNKPRLIISKIVNENFKSYSGTQVIGPFHKRFSAIVGPNGSGKSNSIDSMLFVFGYRASKIRSNKVSLLIHNSSEHTNVRSCTVSVHFHLIVDKPGANFGIVPNNEFVISRTAFKDNSSFYQLNGRKVQFKEVTKTLRSHGVDLDHHRFLILQGEVEQIALMKPKGQSEDDTGMLEFLEDVIGTIRYKEPLKKLYEKVEVLTERRVEKMNRLRIIEKEKADLEKPMQAAVYYLKIENNIIELQHQLYHCKRFKMKKELVQQEAKKEELDKDLADLVKQIKTVRAEIEEGNAEMKGECKKRDALQEKKDTNTDKYENIKKQDEALYAELIETNKRRKSNITLVKSEKVKVEQLANVPEKNAEDIKECERLIETLTASQEKEETVLTTLMSGIREKTEPLLKQRTKLETKLISLRENVGQTKATFGIAQSELDLYISVEQTGKVELEKLQDTLKTTAETLKQRKQQLVSFETKIPETKQNLKAAQKELDQVKNQEAEIGSQLRGMRMRVEEQRSAFQISRSRNRVLDSLMREKREGRLPGIFGRLGDLGAIDIKYDVAISTACGPLDNVVVDTATTAQKCITFLRQNDTGRTTFIPLEKQQRFLSQCKQKIKTPENVPRLFDLIKVEDERVLPAFYYGLRNTLVAEDLEQATRIAYGAQRYRVVTLKGELIETSGTMSGGGRTVLKGRMGQSIVRSEPCAADVERLQESLDTICEEYNQLKTKQKTLENQIETLSIALKDMTMDKEKYTVDLRTLGEQESRLRSQLKEQEKKVRESVCDPGKVQKLKKAVDAAGKNVEKAELNSKSIVDEVARLNADIDELSGGRVKVQQQKITDLSKKIEKAKKEIYRLQVAVKTAERDTKKMEQRIETFENNVRNCEQRIRDVQKERSDLEDMAKDILKELTEVTEALAERDNVVGALKEKVNALETRENKMKALKIDLNQKCNEMTKTLKELHQQITDYTRKIIALKLHIIPGEPQEELKELMENEIVDLDEKTVSTHLENTKERLPEEIPNMQLIKDYLEKDALYVRRVEDLEALTTERNNLRDTYNSVRRRRTQEFLTGFSLITNKLKETYQMITLGGDAELELVDCLDPFSEGIIFSVRPPKKSWKNISSLSGGEKTLSSLALIFALHHFKPTPFYFMDEIDAALDFKNVSIVGNYIKERTKNAQFIVISLRPNMFELANYLVGIYKTYNCTKCVPLDVEKFYEQHGPPPEAKDTNQYESQQQRPFGQSLPVGIRENDQVPFKQAASCPNRIEEIRTPEPTTSNTSFRLPELGLCSTPVRASNASKEMTVQKSGSEESVEKEPFRKKFKS